MTAIFLISLGFDPVTIKRMIEGDLKEVNCVGPEISPRKIMKTLGTDWGRNCIGESVWTDVAMSQAYRHMEAGRDVVIDDLRFKNEAVAIKAAGGEIWRIERPQSAGPEDAEEFDADLTIINDGDLESLHRKVVEEVSRLNARSSLILPKGTK